MTKQFQMPLQSGGNVSLQLAGDENVTVVVAELEGYTSVGTARRAPGDPRIPALGASIATERALRNLADVLATAANEAIAEDAERQEAAVAARERREKVAFDQDYRTKWNLGNPQARIARKAAAARGAVGIWPDSVTIRPGVQVSLERRG